MVKNNQEKYCLYKLVGICLYKPGVN